MYLLSTGKKYKDKGCKEVEILQKQLILKYGQECSWLNNCQIEQLNKVSELIVADIPLDDLRKKVFSK